jgi:hypothetical protein
MGDRYCIQKRKTGDVLERREVAQSAWYLIRKMY